MRQKVYKRDHYENIKMFHDLEHPSEFSAYSLDLNRHFGDRCYTKFYKHLIEHQKLDTNYFKKLFEKENAVKGLKKYDESFDAIKFKKSLKKLEIKEIEYNKKLKNPYYERLLNSNNYLITEYIKKKPKTFKPYYPKVPEVGRYNPSYNFISKHTYEVFFSKNGLNEINQEKDNIKKSEGKRYSNFIKKIAKKQNLRILRKHFNLTDIVNNKKYISTFPNTPRKIISINKEQENPSFLSNRLNKSNKNEQNIKELFKTTNSILNKIKKNQNHSLKFENYTSRKSLIREKPYNTEYNTELPNYYTEKYIKVNIDFNKMSSNKKIKSYFEELANKDKNPPLGFYKPKYNSVMHKTRDIYFNKKAPPSSRRRKFKKIIYSYDVPFNYQIAPSLNDRSKNKIEEYYNLKIE